MVSTTIIWLWAGWNKYDMRWKLHLRVKWNNVAFTRLSYFIILYTNNSTYPIRYLHGYAICGESLDPQIHANAVTRSLNWAYISINAWYASETDALTQWIHSPDRGSTRRWQTVQVANRHSKITKKNSSCSWPLLAVPFVILCTNICK